MGVHQEGSAVLDRIARLDSAVVQGTTSRPAHSLIDAAQHDGSDSVVSASEIADVIPKASEGTPRFVAWAKAAGYKPGSILKLPLDLLDDNPYNPRRFYLQESIDRLTINLSNIGQQSPIQVALRHDAEGRFTIIEGHRRVRALRKLGRATVKAMVVDKNEALDLYKLAFDLNTQRDSQTIFDNAMAWRELLVKGQVESQQALAAFLGIDETTVSMTLSVAHLPEEVLRAMVRHAEHFGLNTSYHIQRYCREKGTSATLVRSSSAFVSKDSQCEQSQLWFVKGKGLPVWRGLGARATISGSTSTTTPNGSGMSKPMEKTGWRCRFGAFPSKSGTRSMPS